MSKKKVLPVKPNQPAEGQVIGDSAKIHQVVLSVEPQPEYELLDSGDEEKLERYGSITLVRPDPQALWEKSLPEKAWLESDATFARESKGSGAYSGQQAIRGGWRSHKEVPSQWPIVFGGLTLYIRTTAFKHTGLFPEQLAHWEWIREKIVTSSAERPVRVLNLFAYTGGATLVAAQSGAQVTHVDASKTAVAWARENAEISKLTDKPIRWIIEDVLLFVKREIKRGNVYDAIIMDPPAFGHGPNDELWKIEEDFVELVRLCEQLLSDTPLFVLISGYAAGYSSLAFAYNLSRFQKKFGGSVECGDLTIVEKGRGVGEPRLLPCGIFGRWSV